MSIAVWERNLDRAAAQTFDRHPLGAREAFSPRPWCDGHCQFRCFWDYRDAASAACRLPCVEYDRFARTSFCACRG